jgi:hypothetical protein
VLKIEDTVDEEPLSDDNEQENNYQETYETISKVNERVSHNLSATSISSNLYDESITTHSGNSSSNGNISSLARPKTAFKTAFDYDEATEVANISEKEKNIVSPTMLRRPDSAEVIVPSKKEHSGEKSEKKKRSKSKDRHHHHHRSSSKRSPSPSSVSNSELFARDSASATSMSRVATGDTGYSSSSSSLTSLRLKSLDHHSHHQPIIVSSNLSTKTTMTNSLNSSSSNLLQSAMHTNNIKPLNTATNLVSTSFLNNSFNGASPSTPPGQSSATSSLKQLKNNLELLSSPIRLPSNNK